MKYYTFQILDARGKSLGTVRSTNKKAALAKFERDNAALFVGFRKSYYAPDFSGCVVKKMKDE